MGNEGQPKFLLVNSRNFSAINSRLPDPDHSAKKLHQKFTGPAQPPIAAIRFLFKPLFFVNALTGYSVLALKVLFQLRF